MSESQVAYGESVRAKREGRLSRNALAERAQIVPGRMWAIEHGTGKPASESERAAIDSALQGLPVTAPPTARQPRAVLRVVQRPTAPTVSLSRSSVGIDWVSLRRTADEVSDHALEKYVEGPEPRPGLRLFSNSEVTTFQDCPRKWWLAYHRTLELRKRSPVGNLAIGGRVHRALRHYYVPDGYTRTDPREALERLIETDWAQVTRVYEEGDPEFASLSKTFSDEADLERIMLEGYVGWLAETGIDENLAVIASETYIEADLPLGDGYDDDVEIRLIGKLDTRVHRRTDNVKMFVDHKTVASIQQARQGLAMDSQMLHYHLIEWLNALENGDERCDGALYNMLRKVRRSNTAKPPFYDRSEVRHNDYALDSYKRRVTTVIKQILDVEERLNGGQHHLDVVPARPNRDCSWKCQFVLVCPLFDDNSRAEDMLTQFYRTHDVFDYYRNEEYVEGSNE